LRLRCLCYISSIFRCHRWPLAIRTLCLSSCNVWDIHASSSDLSLSIRVVHSLRYRIW
jgi:hypothetical protein